uniref:Non-structural maintenance of chromosomes element 1 homolog n=1 Tax=Aureoumbra lagunensis TaxID=44058 RepID=A0A7S3JSM1_9STRA|mmetsp:Transcript_19202/g.24920  ORF Transcript_19202/g.24920 Transcript_19202/m.24920 type:complete len:193 (-) Transcript_19202:1041-1619(-)
MSIPSGHQAFLQALAQRKVMNEKQAIEVLKMIGKSGIGKNQSTDVDDVIKTINKKLIQCSELEIRGVYLAKENGGTERVFVLINPINDEIAKAEGNSISATDAALFRKVLTKIANSSDYHCALTDFDRGQLTLRKFTTFLNVLTEQGWLEHFHAHDTFTFGTRTFVELADHLRNMEVDVPQQIFLANVSAGK